MKDSTVLSNLDTVKHIHSVRGYLYGFIQELDKRAREHDKTKLESPEQEIFGDNYEKLAKTTYGTPEYDKLMEEVKPALDHHYAHNRHHPRTLEVGH